MTGLEILKNIEDHCNEELGCSHRLRFQIAQSIQRLLDKNAEMKTNITNVLNGFSTFDPKTQKAIAAKR